MIHQSQAASNYGVWELNKISSVGGGTNWTMAYNLTNTYGSGAQVYLLNQYTTASITGGNTFTSRTWNGSTGGVVAILANISITVSGTINLGGAGFAGGTGAGNSQSNYGGGVTGQPSTQTGGGPTYVSGSTSGGAGSAAVFDSGAGGGHAANGGSDGVNHTTQGGSTVGTADLVTMVFGGAGGGGNGGIATSGDYNGGASGAICILIAPSITITGAISNSGANGDTGHDGSNRGCAGGGGSGGSVLLKGNFLTLGTNLITATAGSGGSGSGSSETHPGANGAAGRIHADYGTSISGTTNPTIDTRQDLSLVPKAPFFLSF